MSATSEKQKPQAFLRRAGGCLVGAIGIEPTTAAVSITRITEIAGEIVVIFAQQTPFSTFGPVNPVHTPPIMCILHAAAEDNIVHDAYGKRLEEHDVCVDRGRLAGKETQRQSLSAFTIFVRAVSSSDPTTWRAPSRPFSDGPNTPEKRLPLISVFDSKM
jgi:hypothetical protein